MIDLKASKILIVDDNTFYLSLLKAMLKDLNATVLMASSGKEALELFKTNDFALAVLDIQMPEMDGFELASNIRNRQNRDLVPIMFLTAYNSDDVHIFKGYNTGAIDYLTKPVNKTIFLSKVRIFLELDQQKRSIIKSRELLQFSKVELEQRQRQLISQNETLESAQLDLVESRNKYIKLYNSAPVGFFTIDHNGTILGTNLKASKLFNLDQTSTAKTNIRDLISKESISDFDQFFNSIFSGDNQAKCESSLLSDGNKITYIYFEGSLIDEKETGLFSVADITERKEAQIALNASEELYYSLVKTSPDGIVINDLNGYIIEASDMAMKLFNITEKKGLIGQHYASYVPKSSMKSLARLIRFVTDQGMVQNFEILLQKSDNTEFTGELSLTQIKGNNGETKAFMSVVRDISERKLFEKQLRHTERMTGIGEMATGMAHEINQPLNTISLSIDNILFSLRNNNLTKEYLTAKLNKVFDNITRIKKIIDHVRTFSRDQDDFVQTYFNINESIKNSISMISEQYAHKEIELSFHHEDDLPEIKGNAYRFEQVILNLLVNAKDAIEEKRKKNSTRLKKRVDVSTTLKNNHVVIEVKDSGIGISSESIDKVLLPFYTTKAPGQGTGLGLSISYGIIKELGGEIDIKSIPKTGTSIFIKIPVTQLRTNNSK